MRCVKSYLRQHLVHVSGIFKSECILPHSSPRTSLEQDDVRQARRLRRMMANIFSRWNDDFSNDTLAINGDGERWSCVLFIIGASSQSVPGRSANFFTQHQPPASNGVAVPMTPRMWRLTDSALLSVSHLLEDTRQMVEAVRSFAQ